MFLKVTQLLRQIQFLARFVFEMFSRQSQKVILNQIADITKGKQSKIVNVVVYQVILLFKLKVANFILITIL